MAANDLDHINSASTTLDLNDDTTYKLREIKGIYEPSSEPISTPVMARTPAGVYLVSNQVIRRIEVELLAYGSTLANAITAVRALTAQFHVDSRDGALGTLDYTSWNSNRRASKVTLAKDGLDIHWLRAINGKASWALVTARFEAPDATFYNPVQSSATGTNFNGATNVNVSCANAGDEPAYPTITWGAVATNPKVTDAYAKWFQYADTITAGQTVTNVFDPQSKSFTNDVEGDWAGKRESGSAMVRIKQGTNNLVMVGEAGDAGSIAVTWYDRYSSHG